MKERPIIFSAPMVRAILAGTKTQTRRVAPIAELDIRHHDRGVVTWGVKFSKPVKGAISSYSGGKLTEDQARNVIGSMFCPYGVRGDRLWVRETHALENRYANVWCKYAADGHHAVVTAPELVTVARPGMRPSIHMPRWASRITLEITAVRVERLQDISEADAIAEGVTEHQTLDGRRACNIDGGPMMACGPVPAYRAMWEQINGPGSWDKNPWVWVIEFRRV